MMRVSLTVRAKVAGMSAKPGARIWREPRRDRLADQQEQDEHRQQRGERVLGEEPRPCLAPLLRHHYPGEEWHEGGAETRPLGEERAGTDLGRRSATKKSVCHRPRPQKRRGQHVADEAQDAA